MPCRLDGRAPAQRSAFCAATARQDRDGVLVAANEVDSQVVGPRRRAAEVPHEPAHVNLHAVEHDLDTGTLRERAGDGGCPCGRHGVHPFDIPPRRVRWCLVAGQQCAAIGQSTGIDRRPERVMGTSPDECRRGPEEPRPDVADREVGRLGALPHELGVGVEQDRASPGPVASGCAGADHRLEQGAVVLEEHHFGVSGEVGVVPGDTGCHGQQPSRGVAGRLQECSDSRPVLGERPGTTAAAVTPIRVGVDHCGNAAEMGVEGVPHADLDLRAHDLGAVRGQHGAPRIGLDGEHRAVSGERDGIAAGSRTAVLHDGVPADRHGCGCPIGPPPCGCGMAGLFECLAGEDQLLGVRDALFDGASSRCCGRGGERRTIGRQVAAQAGSHGQEVLPGGECSSHLGDDDPSGACRPASEVDRYLLHSPASLAHDRRRGSRTIAAMELLRLDGPLPPDLHDPVLLIALDGWTDAGEGGTRAARELLEQFDGKRLGEFDPDALYDYRDRRPVLEIERGTLRDLEWPKLELHWVRPSAGPDLLILLGAEPDLAWRAVVEQLRTFATDLGVMHSIGLGSVPGPIPHTRGSRLIVTSTEESVFDRFGRPQEEIMVPASAQVALEAELGASGLSASGLWVRIPHYVATDYPEASQVLLRALAQLLHLEVETDHLDPEIVAQREKLDDAASGSPDVQSHIAMLEQAYDQEAEDDPGSIGQGPIPTGDQIAAELERFLREES